jgi:hypothetical protein
MRNLRRRIGAGGLMFLIGALACSSRDNPEAPAEEPQEPVAVVRQELTPSEIARILSFEGQINGTGADWLPANGTPASSISSSTLLTVRIRWH